MIAHIWNSKISNIPYITYCEDNGQPIFTKEFRTEQDRNKQLKIDNIKIIGRNN